MYKIMLVEDEPEVLQSMMQTIQWAKYGFDTPCACHDGQEAIDALKGGFVPQAVITDINMPLVNGLQLTEYIKKQHPKTLVVILSGYDDFTYAQTALKLSVYDYVLKPVTPARLQNMLAQLAEELHKLQMDDTEDNQRIAQNDFLVRLLTSRMYDSVIAENQKRFGLQLSHPLHLAVLIDIDPSLPTEEQSGQSFELMRYGLHNIAQELLQNTPDVIPVRTGEGCTALIVGGGTAAQLQQAAQQHAHSIVSTVQRYLKHSVTAGIGTAAGALTSLPNSFYAAQQALDARFFVGPGQVLTTGDILAQSENAFDFASHKEQFIDAIQHFRNNEALATVDAMYADMQATRLPAEPCAKYSQRLVVLLLQHASNFVEGDEMHTLETAWEQHSLHQATFLQQMQVLTHRFCEQVFELLSLVCSDSSSAQIIRAETYIKQNFNNPKLSLQMLTDYLAVSTSYFSPLFKSRTGFTFVEYLTRLRMEKAKQILAHTDRRTYEVAEDVGFSDPHYFSAAFKRAEGISPREYREQCKNT